MSISPAFYKNTHSIAHRWIGILLILLSPFAVAEETWNPRFSEDGISIYTGKVEGSNVKAFKGIVELDAQLVNVLALLADQDSCVLWVHGCVSSELVERVSFAERYIYQVNKPVAIRARDYIFHVLIDIPSSLERVTIQMSSRHDYLPLTAHVRIKRASGSYVIERVAPEKVRFTWEQHLEPGGFVPGFIINSMLLDIPRNSLRNFRELLKEDKYQQVKFVYSEAGEVIDIESF